MSHIAYIIGYIVLAALFIIVMGVVYVVLRSSRDCAEGNKDESHYIEH
jgi:sensor domain CHASE-containing protein